MMNRIFGPVSSKMTQLRVGGEEELAQTPLPDRKWSARVRETVPPDAPCGHVNVLHGGQQPVRILLHTDILLNKLEQIWNGS